MLKLLRKGLGGIVLLAAAATAQAQSYEWAEKMFEKTSHDFGVVARGADARYRLAVTNKYAPAIHIAEVRTTCGCTAAKPSKDTLESLETAYIEIVMDTRKFTHLKESSLTVVIDRPQYAEVRIPIKAYIRTDVVLTPGGVEFGAITKGTDQERKIGIAYAGRPDWSIRNVVAKNPNITARVVETSRSGINVNYDLLVSVKGSAPVGELREQLTLITDDAGNPQIPVLVQGRVEAEYTVTPEVVSFGNMAPGERKTVNVVVRGRKPFAIEKIESEKSAGTFEVRLPQEPKQIHVLPLTIVAPTEAGTLNEEFTVKIDGTEDPITFKAFGKIAAPGAATAKAK
jgi:hypothetical protein